MTAELDAQNTIQQAQITPITAVYTTNIPSSQVDDITTTQVLIRDNGSKADDLGNDDFWGVTQEVELQIYYAKDLEADPEKIEVAISKAMAHAGWSETTGWRRRVLDPDTQQLMNTNYFTRTYELEE